jgi:hypothetical protein
MGEIFTKQVDPFLQSLHNQSKKDSSIFIHDNDQIVKELIINCKRTIHNTDNSDINNINAKTLVNKINNDNYLKTQLEWEEKNTKKLYNTNLSFDNNVLLNSADFNKTCLKRGINYNDTLDVNYNVCIDTYVKRINKLMENIKI